MDYTYYINFHKSFEYLGNYNKYFNQFMNTDDFNKKTKYILDIINFKEPEINQYKGKLEKFIDLKKYTIEVNLIPQEL